MIMLRHRVLSLSVACVLLSAPARGGGKIVIVRSSMLPLYEQVVQGFSGCNKAAVAGDLVLTDDEAKNDAIMADAASKGPDLYLSLGTTATRVVRQKAGAVPSLFAIVIDPSSNKVAPPGVPMDVQAAVQVEFVEKNFPQLKRIGVLYSPGRNLEVVSDLKKLQAGGKPIVMVEVPSIDKLDESVKSLEGKADCLLMLSDPVIYSPHTAPQLILQTLQRGLPLIAASPAFVKAGALAGIYANPAEIGCVAAEVSGRILAGEKPSSIPYAWPTKYSVAINLVVADRLKIKVSASLTNSAEQVIK